MTISKGMLTGLAGFALCVAPIAAQSGEAPQRSNAAPAARPADQQAAPAAAPAAPAAQAGRRQAGAAAGGGRPDAAPDVISRVSDEPVSFADLPAPKQFVTRHKTTIRGKALSYTATAGETYITNLSGEPIASFFSFAYVKDDPVDANRPIMFVFNGGPGSSSVWLHMGVIGPKRVVLDDEVNPSNVPPFGLRDNPFSILDVADIVFIDPVGTGFSHAVGNAKDADFFGVDSDAESVARFMELWLTKNGRWNSPKFVTGESYGSIRAAVLPRALMGGPLYSGVMRGITLDGIVLLGVALDVGVPRDPNAPKPTEPDPAVGITVPSMAVTAWYHNKVDRHGLTAAQYYDEVKKFAFSDYATAVFQLKAGTLSEADKARVAGQLAAYTGVPAEAWVKANLELNSRQFLKELLADRGLNAGAYDSRYTMASANDGNDPVADDPAMGKYVPGFIAAFQDMMRNDLKIDMPIPYGSIVWENLNSKWKYTPRAGVPVGQGYATDLAIAMHRDSKLHVLAASGYYDLVTPPAAARDELTKGHVPTDRLTYKIYESGHMLYLGDSAETFANDIRTLIATTLAYKPPREQ